MPPQHRFGLSTRDALLFAVLLILPCQATAQRRDPETLALDSLLDIKVSTAAKYAQRIGEAASSVTIITSEDIELYGYRSLEDALATIPGFYTSNDRNYTYLGARGFSRPTDYNNRILVLVDGNTINEAIFGSALLGELAIPLRSIERIEVVRGPGSALYGTGAIFGVINLITKSPGTLDGGEVAAEGGSYGRQGGHALYGHRFAKGAGFSVTGMWDRSDGQDLFFPEYDAPETNNGLAHHLDWERRGSVLATLTNGGFRLHGRYSSRSKAFPTGAYETVFNARGAKTRDEFAFLEMNYGRGLGAGKHLETRSYYNWYSYVGGYPQEGDSLGEVTSLADGGQNEVLGTEGTLRWDIASANRLTIGGEVRHNLRVRYFGENGGDVPNTDFDVPSTILSGYVQDEHQVSSAVSLLGGIRFDRYSARMSALSPRLAMIVTPVRGTVFKLLYGEAFRAPSVYESEVESYSYQRNVNLRPERARTLELVLQRRLTTGLLGSVSMFQYRMQGLIDLTLDSVTSMYTYRNVGSARSRGLEAGIDARLGRSVSGYANYTFQRTLDESDQRLTNSPAHLLKAGAGLALTPWMRPAVQLRYESARRTVYDTYTSSYAVADINLSLTPRFGARGPASAGSARSEHLELSIRLNNVLNTAYATPGGVEHRQPAIRQDGRNLRAEVRYRF